MGMGVSIIIFGPRLWKSLPVQLCNLDITYGLFRRQLKGHLLGTMDTVLGDSRYVAPKKTFTYLHLCHCTSTSTTSVHRRVGLNTADYMARGSDVGL